LKYSSPYKDKSYPLVYICCCDPWW